MGRVQALAKVATRARVWAPSGRPEPDGKADEPGC